MKVSVGNDTSKLTKDKKIQLIDTTNTKQRYGQYLLPRWKVICNDKNNNGVTTNFIRATKKTAQQAIRERQPYHQLVQRLCISQLVAIIMVMKGSLSVGRELILYKLLIQLSIIKDFHFKE